MSSYVMLCEIALSVMPSESREDMSGQSVTLMSSSVPSVLLPVASCVISLSVMPCEIALSLVLSEAWEDLSGPSVTLMW